MPEDSIHERYILPPQVTHKARLETAYTRLAYPDEWLKNFFKTTEQRAKERMQQRFEPLHYSQEPAVIPVTLQSTESTASNKRVRSRDTTPEGAPHGAPRKDKEAKKKRRRRRKDSNADPELMDTGGMASGTDVSTTSQDEISDASGAGENPGGVTPRLQAISRPQRERYPLLDITKPLFKPANQAAR